MIDLYVRLLARCSTVNQVNRVHIALAERMTPLELQELRREMRPRSRGWRALRRPRPNPALRPESLVWVEGLADWSARSGKAIPEPFVRRRVRPNVVSFSRGGSTSQKTIVVCFTGNARRLFMPIPVFLQHVPAERFDLLVLKDPSRNGYREGLAGVAASFDDLVDEVGDLLDRGAYRSVVTFGTSGGGLPAIVTALRLGLDKGVSVAGRGPLDPRWQAAYAGGVDEMLRAHLRAAAVPPNLLLVHGADSEPDAEAARTLAEVVPASTLIVRSRDGQKTGHNAMFPLLLQSELGEFLASAFDPGVRGSGRERELSGGRIET